ncbi:MAG: hypothetical protein Q6366_008845 [Candidatus Freyarchaeota archaeon]
MSKEKNVEKMLKYLDEAWTKPPSIIINTEEYIYCLFPTDSATKEKWVEASLTLPEANLEERNLTPKEALVYLLEEITRGLPGYAQLPIVLEVGDLDKVKEKVKKI